MMPPSGTTEFPKGTTTNVSSRLYHQDCTWHSARGKKYFAEFHKNWNEIGMKIPEYHEWSITS